MLDTKSWARYEEDEKRLIIMIDVHAEVQFYPDLLNTGFSEFHHLLNFLIGPFNLPEKSVIMYPNFSNFNF